MAHMWKYGLPSQGLEFCMETIPEPTTNLSYRADLFFIYSAETEADEFPRNESESGSEEDNEEAELLRPRGAEGWFSYVHWTALESYSFYHLPVVTEFCSADLLGVKVHVPCEPLPTLRNDYGEGWEVPIRVKEEFSYGGNMSALIPWDKNRTSQMFVYYSMNMPKI